MFHKITAAAPLEGVAEESTCRRRRRREAAEADRQVVNPRASPAVWSSRAAYSLR